ncbi:hypothetical protein E2C01_054430 [Portunus trituberculatus]|uniref:Uncharacterized protein n=1 Tax=Portunus trituberculatus TaxID=210409 RepID=A0A5B7GT66_PORTR|nr:hypothetical protein [Portunus trituberculatus]
MAAWCAAEAVVDLCCGNNPLRAPGAATLWAVDVGQARVYAGCSADQAHSYSRHLEYSLESLVPQGGRRACSPRGCMCVCVGGRCAVPSEAMFRS